MPSVETASTVVDEKHDKSTTGQSPVFGASGRKIIYDKDGKPCRSCNTLLDFQMATGKTPKLPSKKESSTVSNSSSSSQFIPSINPSEPPSYYKKLDPPDVAQLGRSSWTLLHSIAATYPETPTTKQQQDMKSFLHLFAGVYPCWYCGEDFQKYIQKNEPSTKSQDDLGKWLCEAHNDVNVKLGKPKFDCNFWKRRWKDGWDEE